MNHGYSQGYTPVLRNINLFHQNTIRPTPTNYPAQKPAFSRINAYPPNPHHYPRVQTSAPYSQYPNSYYNNFPGYSVPSAPSFSSYSVPAFSYAPTVSSKGLSIVLIATLILVALDLVVVRPQKLKSVGQ